MKGRYEKSLSFLTPCFSGHQRGLSRVQSPSGEGLGLETGGGRCWKRDPGSGQGKTLWHGGEEQSWGGGGGGGGKKSGGCPG